MPAVTIQEEARRLVDQLPANATWGDLRSQIYVRNSVEAGVADCRPGRLIPVDDVRRPLGLPA